MTDEEFAAILERVRKAAARRILFLSHALRQMAKPERLISAAEVRGIIEENGEVIEDYPDDARGHSCLILGRGEEGRPIHIVCSPKDEFLAIITAYVPSPDEWDEHGKTRVSR
jgi:hypothetical protein